MRGKRPAKRKGGFRNPPPDFPEDPELYGDPENWKYPLDTPRRARLARRFFSMERNRKKYSEPERKFIDDRIDSALRRFQIDPEGIRKTVRDVERVPDVVFPDNVDVSGLPLNDLLLYFVGKKRMRSSEAILDERLEIEKVTDEYIVARVKEYTIKVDLASRVFSHDCGDWIAWMSKRFLCKHVSKLLMAIDDSTARRILVDLYENGEEWTFTSRPREVFA